ncbi:MAG: mercury methylation corrinoid protein HgcA [Pseudomonadota bacterium]
MVRPRLDQAFVDGVVPTAVGLVPRVTSLLSSADRWNATKVRWRFGRDDYRVDPGLYALHHPDADAPVLVTANYKLSFDALREPLAELNAWILVLDTRGINVWCAAGKGSFSTDEVVRQVEASRLASLVSHRTLVLPQLGAPGVAAHEVKSGCGFKVRYGPIRSDDVPAFLAAGSRATAQMRRKSFDLRERVTLIPVELVGALPAAAGVLIGAVLLAALVWPGSLATAARDHGLPLALSTLLGLIGGAVLVPTLLPWLPGRAFAFKGLLAGLPLVLILVALLRPEHWSLSTGLEAMAWVALTAAVASYLGMMFTGSSSFTSLSGVRREMRLAVPLQLAGLVVAVATWVGARVVAGGGT